MGKKIAIVGTTTSLRDAPYNDSSWEIWGLNGAYTAMPKWDRWFDMHDLSLLKTCHLPAYFDFLKCAGSKLTLNNRYEEYPEAQVFPWKELVDKYKDYPYFTNTIAWLIALAIEENPEEIALYGINMAQESEYGIQRPSCEYFLGIATGKGIKVTIPDSSELLKAPFLYGLEKVPAWIAKLPDKKREIDLHYNSILRQIDECKERISFITGAVQGTNDVMNYGRTVVEDTRTEFTEEDNKKTFELVKSKHLKYKSELDSINESIKELLTKKSYWEGAIALMNYHFKNWSY